MSARNVTFNDGKYSIIIDDDNGSIKFLRHGEPWTSADEQWRHANMIYSAAQRIAQLEDTLTAIIHGTPLDPQSLNRNDDGILDFLYSARPVVTVAALQKWSTLADIALKGKS